MFLHSNFIISKNSIVESQLALVAKAEYTHTLHIAIVLLGKYQQKQVYVHEKTGTILIAALLTWDKNKKTQCYQNAENPSLAERINIYTGKYK